MPKKLYIFLRKHLKNAVLMAVIVICAGLISCTNEPHEDIPKKPEIPMGSDGKVTILLDAGHGFDDIGCKYDYLGGNSESDLTLKFVEMIQDRLISCGYTVLLTHDGESFPDLASLTSLAEECGVDFDTLKMSDNNIFDAYERTVYANCLASRQEIDLMLSIHVNANASSDECEGFEVDYCAENASSNVTRYIFGELCDALENEFESRKMKRFADSWDESFIVTKYVTMPSILLETGFASTPDDAALLIDPVWQSRLVSAVTAGIKNYFEN